MRAYFKVLVLAGALLAATTAQALPDSIRAGLWTRIASGNIAGAIQFYTAQTGKDAPNWLLNFQRAFDAGNKVAGPCFRVADGIFRGFQELGKKPDILILRPADGSSLIGIEKVPGVASSTIQASVNGQHAVVLLEGRIYDAFTGPLGQTVAEYAKRIFTGTGAPIAGLP
ncbi:MAG TPA: hypothetical protein VF815_21440 [Myxococcaceae bacterium]|jgi:hypothetical protein